MSPQPPPREPLTPRERRVLELAAGLVDGHRRTIPQLAHRFGVSEARITEILQSARRKLQDPG